MKLQILLLICVCVFCSCQTAQKAQTNDFSNQTNINQQKIETSANNEASEIKKKTVDVSRFSSVKVKRTDQKDKFSLKIDVEYPQLKKAKTPQEIKFNQYVKKQVDEQIKDFNDFLIDEKLKEVKVKNKLEFEINLDYTVDYFSDNFTSVVMNWNGYSGYLNMDYFPSTINFDLKNGKAVEQKDIFEDSVNYLEKLSESSRKILKHTCLYCGCGNGISPGDPLPEDQASKDEATNSQNSNSAANMVSVLGWYERGTEPEEKNFRNWSITADGLKITFGEYQVGPGCIGIIDIVIPFSELEPILRKDLNFN